MQVAGLTAPNNLGNGDVYPKSTCFLTEDALARLETEEDEAYEDHKKGFLAEAAYHRRVKRIREQRVGFTDLMDKARSAIEGAVFETAESLIELATNAKSLWLSMNDQDKVKYLKTICSNQVLDGPTVRYELKKPFAVLAEMAGKENWRTHCEELRTAAHEYAFVLSA